MPQQLEYQVSNFNKLFIENLSENLSKMMHNDTTKLLSGSGAVPGSQVEESKEGQLLSALEELDESGIPNEHSSEDEDEVLLADSALAEDLENARKEQEVNALLAEQQNELGQIETDIKGQEGILDVIKKSKFELESHLLEAMKMEYHKKVEALEQ